MHALGRVYQREICASNSQKVCTLYLDCQRSAPAPGLSSTENLLAETQRGPL